jgi:hypothetical protein
MTMPVWPFPLVRPSGFVNNDVPNGAEIQQLQEQGAAAADGRVWTDLAAVKNWRATLSLGYTAFGPNATIRDPVSRRWLVFGGNTASASYTIDGSRWFNSGTTNFGDLAPIMLCATAAAVDPAGIILAGGAPSSASTGKIRESTDSGLTWATVRNIGASNTNPVFFLAYSQALALWFCSVNNEGIFSSSDRITWTLRSASYAQYITVRETPSPVLLTSQLVGGGTPYRRSVDGIAWTNETFPENISAKQLCWSDALGKFFASGATAIWSSTTGLTGSWTSVAATTIQAAIASFGRLLIRGDGKASLDGGVSWSPVLELGGQTDLHVVATPGGVAMIRATSQDLYLSTQIGF